MQRSVSPQRKLRRSLLLATACTLAVPCDLLAAPAIPAYVQEAAHAAGVDGTWQGTLHVPNHDLRTVLKISKGANGALSAQFFSIDQGGQALPVSTVSFSGGVVKYAITPLDLTYEGKLSPDGNTITGNTTQGGNTLPLNFDRATPATAWEIPTPPPPIKAMAADAKPSFDVVTVKPSKPDQPGKMFRVEGRRFTTLNTTLGDMIGFAYGIHPKQLVNAPAWVTTDKFDLAGTPDIEGAPNDSQWKLMLQKMLADRFGLKFHNDTRDLSAYALTVAKTGPKLEKSQGDPNGLPGLWFSQLGNLHVTNATMTDFTHLMQEAVLDRPVVDQTNLQGRWNFNLKWTPDESQFVGAGIKITPPKDEADAPPPLFTAVQEEVGLKLDATRTSVPVFVVDHVEKPSEN
jgi:uncharacterized protein (TIGR03435 family)